MNFFKFDKSDKPPVNLKPEVKTQAPQPQNVVRTVTPNPVTPTSNTLSLSSKKETKMTTYVEIQKQIEELKAKAEVARKEELSSIIASVKSTIAEYGLTAADLGLTGTRGRKAGSGAKVEKIVKYRDEQGNTWAGLTDDGKFRRGKLPKWVSNIVESRPDDWKVYIEKFRIAS